MPCSPCPFHRLPPREELPGEPERMGGKVDALVRGEDLSAGPSVAPAEGDAMSPIGMGVIGTGYMGRTYAACLTRHVPDGRLVSVWGGKRAPALAEEFGVEADESLDGAAGAPGGRGGRHHLAAHGPPAAGRGRRRRRQARLHREADGGLGRRLRRDHRRLRRGRGQAHGQLRDPLPATRRWP